MSVLLSIYNNAKMAPSATSPSSAETTDPTLLTLRKTLLSESAPLAQRFRALFSLKHLASTFIVPPSPVQTPALQAITKCLTTSNSALLKHELAYCLGQTRNLLAVETLQGVLRDEREDPMVRHEAAEALGALGDKESLELLGERRDDTTEKEVVRETCEIAVERIRWELEKQGVEKNVRKRYVTQPHRIRRGPTNFES
jgi:deoxyhypusine monooxygenase